jgi:hypothetical protein
VQPRPPGAVFPSLNNAAVADPGDRDMLVVTAGGDATHQARCECLSRAGQCSSLASHGFQPPTPPRIERSRSAEARASLLPVCLKDPLLHQPAAALRLLSRKENLNRFLL